jgi:hypothetical protein
MTSRDTQTDEFLVRCGLQGYVRVKIPGDASFRSYEVIKKGSREYILMNSPPDKEDVRPFIKVDEILRELELSAPEIIEEDVVNGFLLLEYFGNDKFNKLFKETPAREEELYKLAVDVLVDIYKKRHEKFDLPKYTQEKLLAEAMLMPDWYLPLFEKHMHEHKLNKIKAEYRNIILKTLDRLKLPSDVIVLRDYHADNLMLLNGRTGAQQVGLLDFQDALIGNVTYDIMSLLEDARRDVSRNIPTNMIDYFLENAGKINKADFLNDYNILGAQRNLKIIGIFSRLKVRDKKDVYLPLIPRVKNYLRQDLEHEALKELKEFLGNECNL